MTHNHDADNEPENDIDMTDKPRRDDNPYILHEAVEDQGEDGGEWGVEALEAEGSYDEEEDGEEDGDGGEGVVSRSAISESEEEEEEEDGDGGEGVVSHNEEDNEEGVDGRVIGGTRTNSTGEPLFQNWGTTY